MGQKRPDEGVGLDPLSVKLSERTETPARERRAYFEESTQTIIRGGNGEAGVGARNPSQEVHIA